MIEFTDSATEQTTAATDLLLAFAAGACALYLLGYRQAFPWKVGVWSAGFGLLAVAAALGAVVHAFKLEADIRGLLWIPLHLALGLTIALFAVGAVSDCWGEGAGRRLLPVLLAAAVAFFGVTRLYRGGFIVFLIYEAVALLVALGIYGYLAYTRQQTGAGWMVAGVALSVAAAAMQVSKRIRFTLVWEFDHNGAFHLAQAVALAALLVGLRAALAGRQG